MIGDGGHAKQIRTEFGDINVVAIGDNAARKREVEARPGEDWYMRLPKCAAGPSGAEGSIAFQGAVVGAGVTIGRHCILNHQCTVDHDAELADYVHVAPGARVLGGAKIGEGALIGANAVVLPGAVVPAWFTVRACSVFPADYIKTKPPLDGAEFWVHHKHHKELLTSEQQRLYDDIMAGAKLVWRKR